MLGEGRTINVTGNACYIEYVENWYMNGSSKKEAQCQSCGTHVG